MGEGGGLVSLCTKFSDGGGVLDNCYFWEPGMANHFYSGIPRPFQREHKSVIVCGYCGTWSEEIIPKCPQCGAPMPLNYAQLLQTDEWKIPSYG